MRSSSILLFALLIAACSNTDAPQDEVLKSVKVFTVGKLSSGEERRLSGQVVPADRSPLSFGVAGTIATIRVSPGDSFAQGDELARLDDEPLSLALDQARAQVAIARAKVRDAEQTYKRVLALVERGAASRAEGDSSLATLESAKGSLRSEEANLARKERDLRMAKMTAPFAGQVAERVADAYQEVGANQDVLIVQSDGAFEIEVSVPETLIQHLDYGQIVTVRFPTTEGTVEGYVSEISAQTGGSNAYPARVTLSSVDVDLKSGMSASVSFGFDYNIEQDQPVYLIPLSAIATDSAETAREEAPIFIVNENNTLEIRQITIGSVRGNELAVFDGLEAGDRVVVAGVPFLNEGQTVSIWSGGLSDG